MGDGKVIDVRQVLENNAYSTTLQDLQKRGQDRVRVINAGQISALIETAVARALEAHEGSGSQQELVEESRAEFQALVKQRQDEMAEVEALRDSMARLEDEVQQVHAALAACFEDCRDASTVELASLVQEELQRLIDENEKLVAGATDREQHTQVSEGERERVDELRERIDELKESLSGVREDNERLRRELDGSQQEEGSRSAVSEHEAAVLASVMTELKGLKESLVVQTAETAASPSGNVSDIAALVQDKLETFGRKIGISSAVEATDVAFDGMFTSNVEVESNMDDVEVKERSGESIEDAVAKMRAMQKGQG